MLEVRLNVCHRLVIQPGTLEFWWLNGGTTGFQIRLVLFPDILSTHHIVHLRLVAVFGNTTSGSGADVDIRGMFSRFTLIQRIDIPR